MRLLLLLTLLFATTCTQISADNVARIKGKSEYATLQDAVAAAKDGDTITMITDCEVTGSTIQISNKTITLDLNGKKITAHIDDSFGCLFQINADRLGGLIITDTDEKQIGEITCINQPTKNLKLIINSGLLTINSGRLFRLSHTQKAAVLLV